MLVEKMKPVIGLDWDKVSHIRVTLEKPYHGGGLRWRCGTTSAKKNLSYNANDQSSGPPYWPGQPIMYPEDGEAIAGDSERDSFIMPAQACFIAFGYPYAPLDVPKNGTLGFTQSAERERVALMWKYYKMPKGDGTMHPPMNRVGPPDVPHVALRPLNKNFFPIKVDGEELVIRPREFYDFDNPSMYQALEDQETQLVSNDMLDLLKQLTPDKIALLREMLNGKEQTKARSHA